MPYPYPAYQCTLPHLAIRGARALVPAALASRRRSAYMRFAAVPGYNACRLYGPRHGWPTAEFIEFDFIISAAGRSPTELTLIVNLSA